MALREGPKAIETAADEALAARGVADLLDREASGYDAAVVCCTLDVGVDDAHVAIPVLGPGRVAMRIAASLAKRFSVAVAEPAGVEEMRRLAHSYGFGQQLASVRTLGIPIAELADDLACTAQAIAQAARSAARLDGASCLVIGSTAASAAVELAAELLADEPQPPTLIDPASCALLCAEALAVGITAGLPQPRSLPTAAVAS
jgi:allantoin racemase